MDLTKIWKFSLVVELESYTNKQTRIASIETFPEKTVGICIGLVPKYPSYR